MLDFDWHLWACNFCEFLRRKIFTVPNETLRLPVMAYLKKIKWRRVISKIKD